MEKVNLKEFEELGKLQFGLAEAGCLLEVSDDDLALPEVQIAWQRGVLRAQREVRAILYKTALESATSQAVVQFLKLGSQFGIES